MDIVLNWGPIGESLADVVVGDKPKIDITDLRPSRFEDENHLLQHGEVEIEHKTLSSIDFSN